MPLNLGSRRSFQVVGDGVSMVGECLAERFYGCVAPRVLGVRAYIHNARTERFL